MKLSTTIISVAVSLWLPGAAIAQTVFDATTRGAVCRQDANGSRYCSYKVGKDLEFSIAAVGEPDAGISFLRSNIKGDFYARAAVQHSCVIVAAGESAPPQAKSAGGDFAFVSPKNGKVYRTWQECAQGK